MREPFEQGVFTLSLDFELVWGSRDLLDVATLESQARVTRAQVFPRLLQLLVEREMVATWATVGHLMLERGDPQLWAGLTPPRHGWLTRPWLEGLPIGDEQEAPEYYGRSLVKALVDAGQELGSHGFTHAIFGDEGCTVEVADSELGAAVAAAATLGVELRSFVFPRNEVGHVDRLAAHGFRCWRGPDQSWYSRRAGLPRTAARAAHLADVARGKAAPTVLPWKDEHGLWVIPGSASFLPIEGVRGLIPISRRVQRAVDGIDQAVQTGRVAHLWLHPINLAADPPRLLGMLERVLDHAAEQREAGRLQVLSMGQVADLAESGGRMAR